MKAETKYKGSLKLAAIGDALGWITEFEKSQDSLKKKFGTDYINSFHDWEKKVGGRFYGYIDKLNSGSYSDDTQLLLSVARSINKDGFVNQQYFAKKELPNWLLYSRGAGRTIKNAARKIERKSARWNNNFFTFKAGKTTIDYRESGANGAAMRILPIALANFGEPDKIKEEIFGNSIITHGHPRAILGAMLYGYSVDTILRFNPENFNYTNFLTELGKDIHQKFSINFLDNPKLKSWETEWNKNSKEPFRVLFKSIVDETQEYLRTTYKLITNNSSDFDALTKLGCYKNETKGSGTSTVIAGIYLACKYSKEPLKGIEQAVNSIGTDTDSIAAFAGGLIGALHGQSIIPSKWKNVQDLDYIDAISIRLLEISESRAEFSKPSKKENLKSISEIEDDSYEIEDKVYLETLGEGIIKAIDRQKTLTKGKYNLIIDVEFELGQFCRFAKLLSIEKENKTELFAKNKKHQVIEQLYNNCKKRNDFKFHNDEVKKVCGEVGFGNPFDVTKIDNKEKLPKLLIKNNVAIAHLGSGYHQFIQGIDNFYHDFEPIKNTIDWRYKKSLLNQFNSSESNILSVANNQRILHNFLFEQDREFSHNDIAKRSKTYFPHRTKTSFEYSIGDVKISLKNIQIEIDLTIEFDGIIGVFEGKNGEPDSFSIYQLYHPFLYYYNANTTGLLNGKIKEIYGVYVVRDKENGFDILKLWCYTFTNILDITSIKLVKSVAYKLIPDNV